MVIRGYNLPIAIRQTAASAADSVVWSMRNLGPGKSRRAIAIRRISVNVMFDGVAAASQSQYKLCRFRDATPTIGTALTVVKQNTDDTDSIVTDARFLDTGLTVAGVTFDAAMQIMGAPRQVGACAQYVREWPGIMSGQGSGALIIKPDDGLCLRLGVAAVIGDGIQGFIEWDEHGGAY
jgi:hypothetical protein